MPNSRGSFAEEVTLKLGFEASVGVGRKEGGWFRQTASHVRQEVGSWMWISD